MCSGSNLMYAVGFILSGRFIDKVEAKIGYGIAVFAWSLAAVLNGFVKNHCRQALWLQGPV